MLKTTIVTAFTAILVCHTAFGAFSVEVNDFKKGVSVPCPTRSPVVERGLHEYLEVDVDEAILNVKLSSVTGNFGPQVRPVQNSDLENEIQLEMVKQDMAGNEREKAARFWFKQGVIEHLFASSSRLGMDLMALAAPSKLLVRTLELQKDEIRHADVAFDIAAMYSANYSFRGIGPFVPSHIDIDVDYEKISETTALNGAIAEVMSSVIMKFRSELIGDDMPILKGILMELSRDEGRHAALGWDILAWIRKGHPELGVFSGEWWSNRVDGPVCVNGTLSASFGFSGLSGGVDQYLRYYTYKNLIEGLSQTFLGNENTNTLNQIREFVDNINLSVIAWC